MSGVKFLGGFIRRERPGARQIAGMALPSGMAVPLVAVEAGRLTAFVLWEEDRPFRRPLAVLKESQSYFHEVWLVTSVNGAQLRRKALPIEVGIRVSTEEGDSLGVGQPASVTRPMVKDLVHLLDREEIHALAARLGVSDNPLAVAAAGQLKWGSAPFALRICEMIGDRAGPPACFDIPTPEMIQRAAPPGAVLAPPARL